MMNHDVLLHLGKLASLVTTCFTICAVRVGVTADRSAPAGKVAIARVMAIYGLQPKHSHIKTWHEGKVCGKNKLINLMVIRCTFYLTKQACKVAIKAVKVAGN